MRLRQSDALADFPARTLRRLDDGHRTMVLLHDHLDAFLDLGQHAVDIAGEFGFCNADRYHCFDHSVYSLSLSSFVFGGKRASCGVFGGRFFSGRYRVCVSMQ